MSWIAGIGMVLVALLLMWAFSALFISLAAGLIVCAILWLPVRLWRRKQLMREREQNPALDWQQAAQQHSSMHYLLTLLVIWAGCAAGMATFLLLPRSLYSPDMLTLASGIACAIALGALVNTTGNVLSTRKSAQQAAQTREAWGLAASFLGFISMPLMMFASPHAAGWMVLREELRGYDSTQLHIPLKIDDAEHRQALLTLVQPLLEQGSQVFSHRASSRSGSSYTLRAALPARYRFQAGVLELRLGGLMDEAQLQRHLQALVAVVDNESIDGLQLAYAQCQPSAQGLARQRFLGQGSQRMQALQQCVHRRQIALNAALPLLKGNLQQIEFGWDVFRPWLSWPRWQAVDLPEDEDGLLKLDSLR